MKIFSMSVFFIMLSVGVFAQPQILQSETIASLLSSSANAKKYFQSGDVIAFSLRKGRTPKFVQSITQSPFDHLGLLLWEGDKLYVYEFLLNKGVKKSLLHNQISTYSDTKGKTHFLVASTNQLWKPEDIINLKSYLDRQVALELSTPLQSCTELIEKSLLFQNYKIKTDENLMMHHLQRLRSFDKVLGSYNRMQLTQITPPVLLISSLNVRFGTLTQLFWTPDEFLSAWSLPNFSFFNAPASNSVSASCKAFYGGSH